MSTKHVQVFLGASAKSRRLAESSRFHFDQTGTLTRVSPIVSGTAPAAGVNENDLLAVAMSLSTIIVAGNAQTLC